MAFIIVDAIAVVRPLLSSSACPPRSCNQENSIVLLLFAFVVLLMLCWMPLMTMIMTLEEEDLLGEIFYLLLSPALPSS